MVDVLSLLSAQYENPLHSETVLWWAEADRKRSHLQEAKLTETADTQANQVNPDTEPHGMERVLLTVSTPSPIRKQGVGGVVEASSLGF